MKDSDWGEGYKEGYRLFKLSQDLSALPIRRLILIPVNEPDLEIGAYEQNRPQCHSSRSSQARSLFSSPFNDNRFTKWNKGQAGDRGEYFTLFDLLGKSPSVSWGKRADRREIQTCSLIWVNNPLLQNQNRKNRCWWLLWLSYLLLFYVLQWGSVSLVLLLTLQYWNTALCSWTHKHLKEQHQFFQISSSSYSWGHPLSPQTTYTHRHAQNSWQPFSVRGWAEQT